MADDADPVHPEHGEQVTHPAGVRGDRVVGPGLGGISVPEQIGGDDRMPLGQCPHDARPGMRAVPDAVDQQDRRSLAQHAERPPVTVYISVLQHDRRVNDVCFELATGE
jgi:hypothetical protein